MTSPAGGPGLSPPPLGSPRGGPLRRTFFGTRSRTTVTCACLVAVLATAIGFSLMSPKVRQVLIQRPQVVQHVTASPDTVASGNGNVDVSKAYPRLYSAKLGIDVAILPGDGKTPPVRPIAYQYPNTAPIGQPGNTYLYAHDRPGMFYGLHAAVIGDVITVALDPTQKLYFQVTEIHANVAWNDLQWLHGTRDERLTLQTCNLSGDFDPRYIVVSRPISDAQGRALTGGV